MDRSRNLINSLVLEVLEKKLEAEILKKEQEEMLVKWEAR